MGQGRLGPETYSIPLGFFPGASFVYSVQDVATPALFVETPTEVVALDWTNSPIYDLAARYPISLSRSNVADYVRFFFSGVMGRHGRFLVVESGDDIRWTPGSGSDARTAAGFVIRPMRIKRAGADGFVLEAYMLFKDSLFRSNVNVDQTGRVTLTDEELIFEELPVMEDPIAAERTGR